MLYQAPISQRGFVELLEYTDGIEDVCSIGEND